MGNVVKKYARNCEQSIIGIFMSNLFMVVIPMQYNYCDVMIATSDVAPCHLIMLYLN